MDGEIERRENEKQVRQNVNNVENKPGSTLGSGRGVNQRRFVLSGKGGSVGKVW